MPYLKVDDETQLRAYEEKDAGALFSLVKSSYEHLRPFLHWVTPDYSPETAREFILQNRMAAEERKREGYGVFYQGELVGSVGLVKLDWSSKYAEIGYWIAKDFEGRGLITRSCRALIDYAFEQLGINRVEIRCATENARSRAIPEKLGFQLEGVLRQSIWRHERFYDVAIYGVLAEEWRANK
jgi:ribosomal-protein-serine acetyltransferase